MDAQVLSALPPKVASAVASVMKGVKRIEKGDRNRHGGYSFTSVDDFLDSTRPLCAAAGLIIIPDEDAVDTIETTGGEGNGKRTTWLRVRFTFTLSHESGETWDHRPRRTVMVNASMGSQAYGAAQSYAMKQFLRALFQIATGDGEDADTQPNEHLPQARRQPPPAPPAEPLAPPAAGPNFDAIAYATEAETGIMNADNASDLVAWWSSDEQKTRRRAVALPADMLASLKEAVQVRIAELGGRHGVNGGAH